ncbi:unnamed protein product [marine sediment metagenome]|uniref:Uncharacterized protein n=1 Tax=marine sediment metagenome TaxID=412755 RepID=X0STU8_9ZZZZ
MGERREERGGKTEDRRQNSGVRRKKLATVRKDSQGKVTEKNLLNIYLDYYA